MRNNDSFPPHHDSYSPEEQEAILSMAARMQSDSYRSVSLEDLEQTAMISGIDPRFVREAANHLRSRSVGEPLSTPGPVSLDRWGASRAIVSIVAFLPLQIALIMAVTRAYVPMRLFPIAIALAVALGLAMPPGKQWRLPAAAPAFAGGFIAYVFFRLSGQGFFAPERPVFVLFVWVFIQGLVAYATHRLKERLAYEGALSRRRI